MSRQNTRNGNNNRGFHLYTYPLGSTSDEFIQPPVHACKHVCMCGFVFRPSQRVSQKAGVIFSSLAKTIPSSLLMRGHRTPPVPWGLGPIVTCAMPLRSRISFRARQALGKRLVYLNSEEVWVNFTMKRLFCRVYASFRPVWCSARFTEVCEEIGNILFM